MSDTADVSLPPPPVRRRPGPKSKVAAERPLDAQIEVEEPKRVAPSRADATKRERRRRENVDKTGDMKLGFRFRPDPNFEYRWINHGIDGQRLKDKTVDDDWEMVSATGEQTDGTGTALRRAVGESQSGPIYSYLCRKPKDWYEADHRKGQERNDKMMAHIRQGKPPMDISRRLTSKDNVYGAEDISLEEAKTRS